MAIDDAVRATAESSLQHPLSNHVMAALDYGGWGRSLVQEPLSAILGDTRLPTEREIVEILRNAWRVRHQQADANTREFFRLPEQKALESLLVLGRHISVSLIRTFPEITEAEQVRAAHRQLYDGSERTVNPQDVERYRLAIEKRTATFYVPPLGTDIPAQHAYSVIVPRAEGPSDADDEDDVDDELDSSPLHGLADELQRYHEPVQRFWRDETDAVNVIRRRRLITIIGGPGSGKSTLCRKLTYMESTAGRTVFLVRLKRISERPTHETFAAALQRVAREEAGIESLSLSIDPDIVVADALDECEPNRAATARDLLAWADDHPRTRVVVTTRRVGHDASLLPGFSEYDLPHMERRDLATVAWPLIAASLPQEDRRRELLRSVSDAADRPVLAGVTLRTPLFLTFVLRLLLDGKALAQDRASVYSQIIEAVGTPPRAGGLGPATLRRIAEALAFATIDRPSQSARQLIEHATDIFVAPEPRRRENEEVVEAGVAYWEDRRLIERVSLGPMQSYTFMHLSLAEYLASGALLRMSDADLQAWLGEHVDEVRWREAIRFAATSEAADRVLLAMLTAIDPDDPATAAPTIAAECYVERPIAATLLLHELVTALIRRLASGFDLVVREAAGSLATLCKHASERIAQLVAPLLDDSNLITKTSAIGLTAIAGASVTAQQARAFLDAFHAEGLQPAPGGGMMVFFPQMEIIEPLWQRAFPILAELLLQDANTESTRAYIVDRMFDDRSTEAITETLRSIERFGDPTWFSWEWEEWQSRLLPPAMLESHERKLLTWYARVLGGDEPRVRDSHRPESVHPYDYPILGGFYSAFQLGRCTSGDIKYLSSVAATEDVREVFRGILAAIGATTDDALREIYDAYSCLEAIEPTPFIIYSSASQTELDWSRTSEAGLNPTLLLQALQHRSLLVVGIAVELLASGAWKPELLPRVRELLSTNNRVLMHASAAVLSRTLAAHDAAQTLSTRLEGPTVTGCAILYRYLSELHSQLEDDERRGLEDRLYEAITSPISEVAYRAADALRLLKLTANSEQNARIEAAFEHWLKAPHQCARCGATLPKGETHCRQRDCGQVAHTPLRPLLLELARRGCAPPFDEVVKLFGSECPTVAKAARFIVRRRLAHDDDLFDAILHRVIRANSTEDARVLEQILALPASTLSRHAGDLLEVARSGGVHRIAVMKSLRNGWAPISLATAIAREALDSADGSVRDAALDVLRMLRQRPPVRPPEPLIAG